MENVCCFSEVCDVSPCSCGNNERCENQTQKFCISFGFTTQHPVTIYNGSKNKYCDGQRDSSVHGCRLLKAAAVIILLQATCDTGIVVISLYSVLEFYRTCHRITKLFSISSHKTLILLHFFWLPSYDLKYSALPYLFMPPISVCQLVKLWFVAHRTFLGIKNQTKTKKVIHIHIYLYKYLSISNAIF